MLPSYSCFVLNQLHVLVCLNNRVTCVRLNEHMNMFQGSFYVPTVNTTSSIRFYVCFLSHPNRLSERIVDSWGKKGVQRREGVERMGRAGKGSSWPFISHLVGLRLSGGGGRRG